MVSTKSSKSSSKSSSMGGKTMSNGNMLLVVIVVVLVVLVIWWFWMRAPSTQQKSGFADERPIRGYYKFSWGDSSVPPGDWDLAIWFGGEVPNVAIDKNINNASKLNGRKKLLNLGGGTETGIWNLSDFVYINSKLGEIKSAGWDGLCFDVEVCPPNVPFVEAFKNCFANCKKAGLIVFVTMSHLVPWGCQTGAGQGADLVNAWMSDPNVDYISPQLYTQGNVLEPSSLVQFASVKNKILPSIPLESDFECLAAKTGLDCPGYITWLQFWLPPTENVCGSSADDAILNCGERTRCPAGQDSECPSGQKCYGQIDCKPNFCGKDRDYTITNCATAQRCKEKDSECGSGMQCFSGIKCKSPNFCGPPNSWTQTQNNCKNAARCNSQDSECPDGQVCYGGIICN